MSLKARNMIILSMPSIAPVAQSPGLLEAFGGFGKKKLPHEGQRWRDLPPNWRVPCDVPGHLPLSPTRGDTQETAQVPAAWPGIEGPLSLTNYLFGRFNLFSSRT